MASIAVILGQIFKWDTYPSWKFACGNPIEASPISTNYEVVGEEYFAPRVNRGVVEDYWGVDGSVDDMPADAVRTVRLHNSLTGSTIWVLGTREDWATAANSCCGAVPTLPEVTIADPIETERPCGIADVTLTPFVYTYTDSVPEAIIANQKITAEAEADGIALPALSAGGYATVAALLAAIQTAWAAYGTFSAVGTKGIKWDSQSATSGFLKMSFIDVAYCVTLTPGQTFNAVKNGNVITPLGKTVTVVSAAQVISEIEDYFNDGVLTATSSTKINYLGTNMPGGLYTGAAAVVSFALGACS